MTEERKAFEGWAILELMGHRRLGGLVTEQEIAGAAFLRIDVPGEVVHHIDRNKRNNEPSNLLILPDQAAHARLHAEEDERRRRRKAVE